MKRAKSSSKSNDWVRTLVLGGALVIMGGFGIYIVGLVALRIWIKTDPDRNVLEAELTGTLGTMYAWNGQVALVESSIPATPTTYRKGSGGAIPGQYRSALTLLDPQDGRRAHRYVLPKDTECVFQAEGLLWCQTREDGSPALLAVDPATGTWLDEAALFASSPSLIGKVIRTSGFSFAYTDKKVMFETNEGLSWEMDVQSRAFEQVSTPRKDRDRTRVGTVRSALLSDDSLLSFMGSGKRQGLGVAANWKTQIQPLGTGEWLRPSFVADLSRPAPEVRTQMNESAFYPITFQDPPGVLLHHLERVEPDQGHRFTRVDLEGREIWTLDLSSAMPVTHDQPLFGATRFEGGTVLVLSKGPTCGSRAIFLRDDGTMAWHRLLAVDPETLPLLPRLVHSHMDPRCS